MTNVPFPFKKREWVQGAGPTPNVEITYECSWCNAPWPTHLDTCYYVTGGG